MSAVPPGQSAAMISSGNRDSSWRETDALVRDSGADAAAAAAAKRYSAFAASPVHQPLLSLGPIASSEEAAATFDVTIDGFDNYPEDENNGPFGDPFRQRKSAGRKPTGYSECDSSGGNPGGISEGQYDDFETIDWLKDIGRHRRRHRDILQRARTNWRGGLAALADGLSGWVCVGFIAVVSALVAGIVDIGTAWMSDLREGVCPGAFWLNREQCCWSANDTVIGEEMTCSQWFTWGSLAGDSRRESGAYALQYALYVAWSLAFALLAALLVRVFAPYACGSGIPEIKTILSGFVIRGYLGKWTLAMKSIGIMLSVSSGLSLGKEGPMVHIASCCGNIIAYLFPKYSRNEAKKREVLSAAAAAGVAIAFGAPLGGVLFSLEEASYYFPLKTLWRSFFCSMVAASVLKLVNPFGNDHLVLFSVDYRSAWSAIEIGPFILLGVIGGVFGAGFIRANVWLCRHRKYGRLGRYPIAEVLTVAGVTALVAFPNPYTRMNTSRLIKLLFSRCGPEDAGELCDYRRLGNATSVGGSALAGPGIYAAMWKLAMAYVFKMVATVFTFGIKVPSGLFIPSLAVGAIAGRVLGNLLEQLAVANMAAFPFRLFCRPGQTCVNSGLYAMVGAAAALGGVTRMTLSLVAIMLELTGGLEYILPLMIAAMTAKWVGDRLTGGGIYEAHIRLNGYPFLSSREEAAVAAARDPATALAGDAMRRPLRVLYQDCMTVDGVGALLFESDVNGFPVVLSPEYHYLLGFVARRDLLLALEYSRKKDDSIVGQSPVRFADTPTVHGNPMAARQSPKPLNLSRIVDLSPIAVTDQTPMDVVLDMFRKLGLRQTLVTRNGRLLGLITKKDALRYVEQIRSADLGDATCN